MNTIKIGDRKVGFGAAFTRTAPQGDTVVVIPFFVKDENNRIVYEKEYMEYPQRNIPALNKRQIAGEIIHMLQTDRRLRKKTYGNVRVACI